MTEFAQPLLAWVNANPELALLLLFLVAMLDAVFIVGALVPAGIVLFGMGALVTLGMLDLPSTILVAALGAVAGDAFSFWLGRHYHERLFDMRLFRRYPQVVANGRAFFQRHGGKSVMLARFLGPVRALTPAFAGAYGMSPARFFLTDAPAALGWAIAYVLPGAVFGASLGLAAEVAGRLAVLLLVLLLAIWLGIWLTLFAVRQVQGHAERWIGALLDWSRRHRHLGKFGAALADPDQPETPVLALLAGLLLVTGSVVLWLWASPILRAFPAPVDAAVFQTMRDLHTPWGIELAQVVLLLGEWPVYAPVALVAFVALVVDRKPHAAAHWVAAVGFAAVISVGLYLIPTLAPPWQYFGTIEPAGYRARDLVLASVIYCFMPVLVSTGRSLPVRATLYGVCITILMLIVLARLYLGAQWYSLALFSVVIAAVWAALLGLGYRRHGPERIFARGFMLPVMATFFGAAIVQWSGALHLEREPLPAPVTLYPRDWLASEHRLLPAQRQDIAGRERQALRLQWAAPLPAIEQALAAAGWQPVARAGPLSALRWLTASTPIDELPVLPQVHAGEHQALAMRLPAGPDEQWLLNLWPTDFQLRDGTPIWVGSIARQRARTFYRFLRYPVSDGSAPPLAPLLGTLPGVEHEVRGEIWLLRS